MRTIKISLCVVMVLYMAVPVFACYSGLNLIPTVDMLDKSTLSFDLQTDGKIDGLQSDTWILNSQYGLSDRFEFGVDYDFSEGVNPRTNWNAKYLIPANTVLKMPIALGICRIADQQKADLYAVTAYETSISRLHLGYGRFSDQDEWLVGADKEVGKCDLMLEYIHGKANFAAIGVSHDFSEYLGISASFVRPNAGGDNRYTMHIIWSLPFESKSK